MNRHTLIQRLTSWALAAVMAVSLAGCGPAPGSNSSETVTPDSGSSTPATGSWQEEDVTPSETARTFTTAVTLADGSLRMLEVRSDNTICLWTSRDNGASWQESSTDWVQQTGADSFGVTRLLPDGRCFLTAVTGESGNRQSSYWIADVDSGTVQSIALPDSFVELSDAQPINENTLLLLGLVLSPASADVPDVLVDENGMMRTISAWKLDLSSGNCEELPGLSTGFGGSTISGMAADPSETDSFYSLRYSESGCQLIHTTLDGNSTVMFDSLPNPSALAACADETGNYYYASQGGIYRIAKGGTVAEQMVDASGTALADDGHTPWGLTRCVDGSFLVIVMDSQTAQEQERASQLHIYRYFWDTDTPTTTISSTLTVWSLEKNDTVQSAITVYEAAHPGCTVDYQVALSDSAVTREDAVSTLNAALLAGSGPDVLILDGLDWEAYQDKGLLADLTGCVDLDSLQSNLIAPFQNEDGSVCVLPARFAVPVLCGTEAELKGLTNLDALADALLALPARPAWDASDTDYYQPLAEPYGLGFVSVEQLLDFALDSSAPALVQGGINSEAVGAVLRFVQQVGVYYGMDQYNGLVSNGVVSGSSGSEGVPYSDGSYECFFNHNAAMAWDNMLTPAYVESVYAQEKDFTVALRPGLVEGAFLPKTLAAISVSSTAPEDAADFLAVLFGDKVQSTWQQDGMPVQSAALQNSITVNCPDDGAHQNVQALIDALKTPATPLDSTVYDILLKNAKDLIAGDITLEQAQAGVEDALTLYLAEQS